MPRCDSLGAGAAGGFIHQHFIFLTRLTADKNWPAKITSVRVFLSNGYWLGKYEVTQSQWKQVLAFEPWKGKDRSKEGDDFPATCVSWEYAMRFCRKLTELEREAGRMRDGWEYTLPTEAQWERACRARTETVFSFGDDESKLGEYAWFSDNAMKA